MARRCWFAVALAVALVAAGCSGGGDESSGRATTTTAVSSTTTASPDAGGEPTTTAPTTTAVPGPVVASVNPPVTGPAQVRPGPARGAADRCPAVPERNQPRSDRPSYELTVDVKPDEGIVVGTQKVRFTPDLAVDQLVFRLWANAPRITRSGGRSTWPSTRCRGRPSRTPRRS